MSESSMNQKLNLKEIKKNLKLTFIKLKKNLTIVKDIAFLKVQQCFPSQLPKIPKFTETIYENNSKIVVFLELQV